MKKHMILRLICLVLTVLCVTLSCSGCVDTEALSELILKLDGDGERTAEGTKEAGGTGTHETGTERDILTELPPEQQAVVRATVERLPHDLGMREQYFRVYKTAEKVKALTDYISSLELISDFEENPNEYDGSSYIITLTDRDGAERRLVHFGNMFLREGDGGWKKMQYEQAQKLDEILGFYQSDLSYDVPDDEMSRYTEAARDFIYRSYGVERDCLREGEILAMPGSTEDNIALDIELKLVLGGVDTGGSYRVGVYSGLDTRLLSKNELADKYAPFSPYATDAAFDSVKRKVKWRVSQKDFLSCLSIDEDGYLCMKGEVIVHYDEAETDEQGNRLAGTELDHIHVFLDERICRYPIEKPKIN